MLMHFPILIAAAWTTLWISVVSIACGLVLGLFLSWFRIKNTPLLSPLIALYVSVGRATPLVTLTLFLFILMPAIGVEISAVAVALITLVINTATFNTEIWRAAYFTIPKSQLEAADAMGMSRFLSFRRVLWPQMLHHALPSLVNEMTFLVKGTPAIAVIGIVDLTRAPIQIAADTYEPLPPLILACVLYMIFIALLVRGQRYLERRSERYIRG